MPANQHPEQQARDKIDSELVRCGWLIQSYKQKNIAAGVGVAIREYVTDTGPADYILFVNKKPIGEIEAKRVEEGLWLIMHEEQSTEYADAKLKYLHNERLRFVYESTGELTRFTDYHELKPCSRPLFTYHRPETFAKWLLEPKSLRAAVHDIPSLQLDG